MCLAVLNIMEDHCNEHPQYDDLCVECMHARRAWRKDQLDDAMPTAPKKPAASVKQRRTYDPNNKDAIRYREHRARHPKILKWLIAKAKEAKYEKGQDAWSVMALIHVVRWFFDLEKDADGYKINDHVASYYAREIMMKEPGLYGYFETRTGNADFEPLGPNGETWFDFQLRKLEEEKAREHEEGVA